MPAWTADTPLAYWDAADAGERANGRLYKSIEAALPRQLTPKQQVQLARDFAAEITTTPDGDLPYTLSIHGGHGENPHLHLTVSERVNDGHDRDPATWFKRAKKDDPAAGGAAKTRALKPRAWLDGTRRRWAELQNERLKQYGHDVTVDHRSHADRGLDQTPSRHLGPTVAEMEKRGVETDRGREVREHQQRQDARLAMLGDTQKEIRQLQERKREIVAERQVEAKIRHQLSDDPHARKKVEQAHRNAARMRRARRQPRTAESEKTADRKVGIRALVDYNREQLEKAQQRETKAEERVREARRAERDLPSRWDLIRSTDEWKDMEQRQAREDDDLRRELTEDREAARKAERNPVWRMVDRLTFGKAGPIAAARKDYSETAARSVQQEREHHEEQHEVERQVSPRVHRHMGKHHRPVELEVQEAEVAVADARKERREIGRLVDLLEVIQHTRPEATFAQGVTDREVVEYADQLEREYGLDHGRERSLSR